MWTVNGEIMRSSHASDAVRAAEVIQDDDAAARAADAAHFARDGHRIGHDADEVRRVDDVEDVVGEFQIGGVHLEQPHVPDAFARDPFARLLEHRARQIDAGDRAVARIERRVDAGADADLEHAIAGLDAHPLDGVDAAGMQRGAEGEVVDPGELFVDAVDEIVFDGGDGERPGRGVRTR